MIEPLAVGFWARERLNLNAGSSVLVNGADPIDVLAAQVAHARGASRIVVYDICAERLGSCTGVWLLFGARARTMLAAIRSSRAWTTLTVSSSAAAPPLPFKMHCRSSSHAADWRSSALISMVQFQLTFGPLCQGTLNSRGISHSGVYPRAIARATSRQVSLGAVITHRFPLEETQAALGQSTRDMTSIKSVVIPWQEGQ